MVANGSQANPGVAVKATTQGLNAGKSYRMYTQVQLMLRLLLEFERKSNITWLRAIKRSLVIASSMPVS